MTQQALVLLQKHFSEHPDWLEVESIDLSAGNKYLELDPQEFMACNKVSDLGRLTNVK